MCQRETDGPICTYEGTSAQTVHGNQRSGEEGNLLKTHTVRREKSSVAMGETGRRQGREQVIPKETEVAWSRKGRSLSMLGEKCNIKEIGEQTICGDFTILG